MRCTLFPPDLLQAFPSKKACSQQRNRAANSMHYTM